MFRCPALVWGCSGGTGCGGGDGGRGGGGAGGLKVEHTAWGDVSRTTGRGAAAAGEAD